MVQKLKFCTKILLIIRHVALYILLHKKTKASVVVFTFKAYKHSQSRSIKISLV
ncbi:hypothetical protein Hanom_Chr11g00990981 [Helianthus anomalus]